jgi:hypothetical protein
MGKRVLLPVVLVALAVPCLAQAPVPRSSDAMASQSSISLRLMAPDEVRPAASPVAAGTLYGVGTALDGANSLIFSVDHYASSPSATPLARFPGILLDVGIDPTTRQLYVLDASGGLWLIDLTALSATLIGTGTLGSNALVFDTRGQAYAWGFDRFLYAVSKTTGAATAIGDTGRSSAGDLAFDLNGTLYGTASDGNLIRINPATGAGTVVGQTGFNDFFGLMIDGTGTLYGARGSQSSNLAAIYRIDKTTGASSLIGSIANDTDSVAGLALVPSGSAPSSLFLNNGRFRVDVQWTTSNGSGAGNPVQLTSDTGYFWFFSAANVELIIKVLNGCGLGGHYWVFAAGLTNVQTSITVTDTQTGAAVNYKTVAGPAFPPIQDTSAFATCP